MHLLRSRRARRLRQDRVALGGVWAGEAGHGPPGQGVSRRPPLAAAGQAHADQDLDRPRRPDGEPHDRLAGYGLDSGRDLEVPARGRSTERHPRQHRAHGRGGHDEGRDLALAWRSRVVFGASLVSAPRHEHHPRDGAHAAHRRRAARAADVHGHVCRRGFADGAVVLRSVAERGGLEGAGRRGDDLSRQPAGLHQLGHLRTDGDGLALVDARADP